MKALLARQLFVQRSITRALDNVRKLGKANFTAAKLRSRLDTLHENWTQFQEGHLRLLEGTTEVEREEIDYFRDQNFEVTEEVYQSTKDTLSEWLEGVEPPPTSQSLMQSTCSQADATSLALTHMPPISLPPFDGNISEWEQFRDRFAALVIKNTALSDFARMHYLASSVTGSAFSCISDLSITADNFQVAWATLAKRFDSRKRLVKHHFDTLFGLSALQRESATDLQILCDKVEMAVSALRMLDRSSKSLWSDFLVQLLTRNLDPASRKAWNLRNCDADDLPNYKELIEFLHNRCHALEEAKTVAVVKPERSVRSTRVHVANAAATSYACPLCKAKHFLSACPRFLAQRTRAQLDTVKRLKRCTNCLAPSHTLADCRSAHTCRTCQNRHHTLLHADAETPNDTAFPPSTSASTSATSGAPSASVHHSALNVSVCQTPGSVLLATARVTVTSDLGRAVTIRALLDQGSEATFISESVAQILRAKRRRCPIAISAIGGASVGHVRQAIFVKISSPLRRDAGYGATALILDSLTAYAPKRAVPLGSLSYLTGLTLADPNPTQSGPIHLIIGADLYGDLLREGLRKGQTGQPIAQNTALGWVLSGPLRATDDRLPSPQLLAHHCTPLLDLDASLRQFWEVEEIPAIQNLNPRDAQCEDHFLTTHSRDSDGRYIVRLPFISPIPRALGDSRPIAARQLGHLLRRMKSRPELQSEYAQFLQDYEEMRHMRRVLPASDSSRRVYIPHHPVVKTDSATTKLRVVFNASSATTTGVSLNDILHSGPKLQTELPAILLQWRQFRFVYTADIAKMFRQIKVDERDVDSQCILWQPEATGSLQEYQLLTVTYGMTCAPYLALRVLRQLADDDGPRYPLAVPILRRQIYVDDVLFGDHEIAPLKHKRDQLISLLRCGQFTLRKWASNSSQLLDDIDPRDHGLACDKFLAQDTSVKVLGMVWTPSSDAFHFRVSLASTAPNTKRSVLSFIARLYDPLGLVTPVTVAVKILMQALWRLNSEWDSPLPDPIYSQWSALHSQFSCLEQLRLPRWTGSSPGCSAELHGFADASNSAYAASVYLRLPRPDGTGIVTLLAGKSKVAPIKSLTIPRLELSASLLLARLITFVRAALELGAVPCTCWADSTIVLQWIRSQPPRKDVFVANRVAKIHEHLSDAVWRHVPTLDNPADCASRGIAGLELLNHPLWWRGPPWLVSNPDSWPSEPASLRAETPDAELLTALHVAEPPPPWDLAERFGSWNRLIRVTAYLQRFIDCCRHKARNEPGNGPLGTALSATELSSARLFWLRRIQRDLFASDIHALQSRGKVASRSPLAAFNPFLDRDDLLRVGGRLRHAPLSYDVRHPILLSSHHLVRLLIQQTHLRVLHGGLQLTLSTLRQAYWILRARSLVKAVIHSCVACVRERATVPSQLMGNLPAERVTPPPRPFTWCGLDYGGPVRVRPSAGRGIKARKAYIALFVCLSTRAVHLELVSDYGSSAFLAAFTRFCSRRGLPHSVFSDNGTNFVGADRELSVAFREALRDPDFLNHTAQDKVSWHFIPPSAPHFGGLWEAGIKSVKYHLHRIVGAHTLTAEEFSTLLCQVEACLNSRPLAPLSDTYDDCQALTPSHFLVGSILTTPPEPSLLHLEENRLSRWQLVRQMSERFWRLWATDYVNTLQQRSKWRKVHSDIEVGRLVLLRSPSLPPCKWELGRIIQVHPGADGLTRVVTIRTASSTLRRPIAKLCVLPVKGNESSSEI
ncbi:uncharacterized protein [Cardiocondyla obscurior]|uniref:uncharacterized protein n=1 Tax=Cardiocondyla obscurior TaxID=286306 RepID=UPI0039656988